MVTEREPLEESIQIGGARLVTEPSAPELETIDDTSCRATACAVATPRGRLIRPTRILRILRSRCSSCAIGQKPCARRRNRCARDSLHGRLFLLVAVIVLSVTTSACRPNARRDERDERIVVRGSDTMSDLVKRWAAAYPAARVEVSGGGTGTGIAALTNGTADVAAASRRMTADERRVVTARRGEVVEETVALDAVAIYVHADSPVVRLTLDDARAIYRGEISSWARVGGPARAIARYSRENSSGTYAFFKDKVLGGDAFAVDVQCLPGTAAVVRAVARDRYAIGYGGIAATRGVRAIAIVDREGRVSRPTREAATSGQYPLARPLYMYFPAAAPEGVSRFVRWLRTAEAQRLAEGAGFFPAPGDA